MSAPVTGVPAAPPLKVSVVVPTYAPPADRLDALVRSLEAQTMPAEDFEVVFVDDGSPDDTWQRLQHIRDTHPNVVVERIENSGWPSRPRNVGIERARGEYVLFMDHDDELYPRALEAGHAMAVRTRADVLNGKETRTDQSKWALEVYRANLDNAVDRTDLHPLIPTNPHKLFRRAMLLEHGIRFPEGGRVLWEDVFFALDVAPHAEVISVLADTPFYHWVRGRTTTSSSFSRDRREYWRWVREIIERTNLRLGEPRLAGQWRLMLLHQYRSRVLTAIGSGLSTADPAEAAFVRETVEDLLATQIPPELDQYLTPTQLGRAALLRAGRWDLLPALVAVDAGLVGIGTATAVRWRRGRLHVTTETRWTNGNGGPLAIRRDGDRVVRDLPPEVAAALPDGAIDMTAAIAAASGRVGIRGRESAVSWMLPGECDRRVDDVDGRPELVVTATAVLDPEKAVFGRPLDERSWELTARSEFLGAINQRGLRTTTSARSAVVAGRVHIAYRNRSGMLALDVDQRMRSLTGSAPLDADRARSTRQDQGVLDRLRRRAPTWTLEVPFKRLGIDDTVLEGTVTVGDGAPVPCRVLGLEGGAWLQADVRVGPGTHRLGLHLQDRDLDTGLVVEVREGALRVLRPAEGTGSG